MCDARDKSVPDEHHVPRTGQWMSQDKRHNHKFLNQTIDHVDKNPKELTPVMKEFKVEVEKDTRLWMLVNLMFTQIPDGKDYLKDPAGQVATVRDFPHLVKLLNHVLTTAPRWTDAGHKVGVVGVPINALFDWPMATRAGFAVFQDPKMNSLLKKVLDAWGAFLCSPESATCLGTDIEGWFGEAAVPILESVSNQAGVVNGLSEHKFHELFQCDPSAPHHDFKSWDDFFTRLYRPEIRPVVSPEDDNVVANACESQVYKVAHNVHARDRFWVKNQPYSVMDMLAFDSFAEQFVGGTIYQAFLSALSYHRWHSPVSGRIVKAYVVDGTYYSEPLFEAFNEEDQLQVPGGINIGGENASQEYLSAVATRGIIFIEADHPKIGLMAFIAIGMVEVSTCDITVREGQHVKKGDQLGMFHFGGSSHCVLFRKGVKVSGFPEESDHNVPVRSKLCVVE